jgi:hypothetical protein
VRPTVPSCGRRDLTCTSTRACATAARPWCEGTERSRRRRPRGSPSAPARNQCAEYCLPRQRSVLVVAAASGPRAGPRPASPLRGRHAEQVDHGRRGRSHDHAHRDASGTSPTASRTADACSVGRALVLAEPRVPRLGVFGRRGATGPLRGSSTSRSTGLAVITRSSPHQRSAPEGGRVLSCVERRHADPIGRS